ncbi:MAG: hypothetical protein Satyrvirus15_3 [Satyrvirus sp.]|uniref:Uncharacterized protein n=1 Tax=Satyrvirus sp. TaxID=2487771 RepID=A0A3G5ADV7_9VIRU|nr:MAG: hypothetical protein Satyrvirus15_3 [Satyrvirus sp.]
MSDKIIDFLKKQLDEEESNFKQLKLKYDNRIQSIKKQLASEIREKYPMLYVIVKLEGSLSSVPFRKENGYYLPQPQEHDGFFLSENSAREYIKYNKTVPKNQIFLTKQEKYDVKLMSSYEILDGPLLKYKIHKF